MQIPTSLLLVAIFFYIKHNSWKIKKLIRNVGLFWAIGIGLVYLAIGAYVLLDDNLNSTTLFLAFMMWVLLEMYSYTNQTRFLSNEDNETNFNPNTFYDVAAKEIITMREQLTTLSINQDSLGLDEFFNKKFIHKFLLCEYYRKHYIVNLYTPPNDKIKGGIILIVGRDILGNNDIEQMNSKQLCKLHNGLAKTESEIFHKGKFIGIYLQEKGVYEDFLGGAKPLYAEILSINDLDFDLYGVVDTEITLKIDISDDNPYLNREPEHITRTIILSNVHHHFIDDNEFNKLDASCITAANYRSR